MTSSDFQQQVTYQRALEGELRKTIEAIDGVQTAVVHLAIPQEDVFADNAADAHGLRAGQDRPDRHRSRPRRSKAIVHLVSSSVPKLTADQVTVADSSGHVLNAAGDTGGASALTDAQAQQAAAFEDDTTTRVQTMLDKLVGPGHAVTRVDAALNFDQQTTDKQEYISDKKNPPLTDTHHQGDLQRGRHAGRRACSARTTPRCPAGPRGAAARLRQGGADPAERRRHA